MFVALIGCSAKKAPAAAIPCLLYLGTRFQLALDKAIKELKVDRVFAVSAKHGLVHLYEKIEPYDVSLKDFTPKAREAWGLRVAEALQQHIPEEASVLVFADDAYAKPLRSPLTERFRNVSFPLAGMSERRQKEWLAPAHLCVE